MNPCPCGYYGADSRKCKCTPGQIERYVSKISGPLVDRIDIHIDVPAVGFSKLRSKSSQLDSATIRTDVIRVRAIQTQRFGDGKIMTNARMSHKQVEKFCPLDSSCEMILKQAMTEFGLSAARTTKSAKSPAPSPTSRANRISSPNTSPKPSATGNSTENFKSHNYFPREYGLPYTT